MGPRYCRGRISPHFHLSYQKSFRVTRSNLAQLESISTKGGKAGKHRAALEKHSFLAPTAIGRARTAKKKLEAFAAESLETFEVLLFEGCYPN